MASTLKITWSGFGPWGVGQVIVGDARCATGRPRTPVLMLTMSGHAVPNDLRLSCAYGGRSTRGAVLPPEGAGWGRGRSTRRPARGLGPRLRWRTRWPAEAVAGRHRGRRWRSEEHTSELQSLR